MYTWENTTRVYFVSITLLASFELDGKELKSLVVTSGMRKMQLQIGRLGTRAKNAGQQDRMRGVVRRGGMGRSM